MKKTVIIAILLIYLGSIVVVNFFGLKVKNFEGTKYVESITCTVVHRGDDNANMKEMENPMLPGVTITYFKFIPGAYSPDDLENNPNVVQLDYHVYPENADDRKVKLEYDETAAERVCVINDTNMTVVFFTPGSVTIKIVAADGSNVKKEMQIAAMP